MDEKAQYEINQEPDGRKSSQDNQHEAVQMGDRKDSIVMQEAADLYGDIETAESESNDHLPCNIHKS